jgi:hypothetical protein
MGNHKKIPSVISFSPPTEAMEQQWGSDLSEDAVTMIHTKLELDIQDVAGELDLLIQAMEGMKDLSFQNLRGVGVLPAYTDKSAEQVVTEYLSKVFEYLSEVILNFSKELRDQVPVDIVVTVPTVRLTAISFIPQPCILICVDRNGNTEQRIRPTALLQMPASIGNSSLYSAM